MTAIKQQKGLKIGSQVGSVINWMMSANKTLPVVGQGATILSWSDRHTYEVLSVSEDGRKVVIQAYRAERTDTNGMSESQDYKYEILEGSKIDIIWRNNAWRRVGKSIVLTDEFRNWVEANQQEWRDTYNNYCDENHNLKLIEGKTKIKMKYTKINILWGVKDEYYDYSF